MHYKSQYAKLLSTTLHCITHACHNSRTPAPCFSKDSMIALLLLEEGHLKKQYNFKL